ncbi:MAG: carbamoyltransferase [Planctomycetaceae bacterium]
MTAILGISAFYHDSAAALVVDGQIIAAAQEERFTRKKHDEGFPQNAVDYCLRESGLTAKDLDYVGFYDKPLRKFERLLETYLSYAPVGYRSFRKAMPLWLKQKLYTPRELRQGLRGDYHGRFVFTEHHESHAASAFFPSPFEEAAILTLDGVGEWSTTAMGTGRGNRIELTHEVRFPHSLGLLYSAFTYYTGFKVNSGEYKLMGLAPYGQPIYRDLILEHLLELKEDGSFRMDMSYFNYCQGLTMTSAKLHSLFGSPPRRPETEITQREMDLAASIQAVTEEVMLRMARHAHQQTGMDNLVLAGGVALNCVGNGRILREGPFRNVWIQPASGDAGGALGTALFIWHQLLQKPRTVGSLDSQDGSFLGPAFTDEECAAFLKSQDAVFETVNSDHALCENVAALIAQENVIGWFQGRMEFGPRALGGRSLLGDARSEKMQSVMNLKIKFRESFRPFAPIVLKDRVHEYFEMEPGTDSPYMLLVAPVREEIRTAPLDGEDTAFGIDKLKHRRSEIPAVTHVDYSARVQTIDAERNPLTHQLLKAFEQQTGCPVLINTSFNVRSEPIVCTPEDAWRCFMMTDMDVLVLGRHILKKTDQPNQITPEERQKHLTRFELD